MDSKNSDKQIADAAREYNDAFLGKLVYIAFIALAALVCAKHVPKEWFWGIFDIMFALLFMGGMFAFSLGTALDRIEKQNKEILKLNKKP